MTQLLIVGSPVVLVTAIYFAKYVFSQVISMIKYLAQRHYEVKELRMLLDSGVDNAVVTNDYIAFGLKQELGTPNSNSPQKFKMCGQILFTKYFMQCKVFSRDTFTACNVIEKFMFSFTSPPFLFIET